MANGTAPLDFTAHRDNSRLVCIDLVIGYGNRDQGAFQELSGSDAPERTGRPYRGDEWLRRRFTRSTSALSCPNGLGNDVTTSDDDSRRSGVARPERRLGPIRAISDT
jgi:hypothetical protein